MNVKQKPHSNHDASDVEPTLIARRMKWDDIPAILAIASESGSTWIRPDFRLTLQVNETLGFVVESEKSVVGFALCTVQRCQIKPIGNRRFPIAWIDRLWQLFDRRRTIGRTIRLFALATAVDHAESEIERLLLEQIDLNLYHPSDRIEALVPETNVAAQSILREAGFSAERLVRGHFLSIDGYLMARQNTFPKRRPKTVRTALSRIATECTGIAADSDG